MTTQLRHRLRRVESPQNALVKELRRSFRSGQPGEDGFTAIEGTRLLEEAIRSGLRFRAVFFRQSAEAQADRLLPQLGTAVRSAEAFGASGVLLAENTVSRFNPKAVRASAGSIFRLPMTTVKLAEAAAELRRHGLRLFATSSHQGTPVEQAELAGAMALFLGSEGAGLPHEALALMDEVLVILHSPRVESLNAGIAASILLYEAARQRRQKE